MEYPRTDTKGLSSEELSNIAKMLDSQKAKGWSYGQWAKTADSESLSRMADLLRKSEEKVSELMDKQLAVQEALFRGGHEVLVCRFCGTVFIGISRTAPLCIACRSSLTDEMTAELGISSDDGVTAKEAYERFVAEVEECIISREDGLQEMIGSLPNDSVKVHLSACIHTKVWIVSVRVGTEVKGESYEFGVTPDRVASGAAELIVEMVKDIQMEARDAPPTACSGTTGSWALSMAGVPVYIEHPVLDKKESPF